MNHGQDHLPARLVASTPRMPRRRRPLARVVSVLFVIATAAAGTYETLRPSPRLAVFGEERRLEDALEASATWRDGSAARRFESRLKRTSTLRRTLGAQWGLWLYRQVREAGERLVVGRDGWLFLPDRVAPQRASTGASADVSAADREHLERAARPLGALARRFASLGMHLVVAPGPRKAAVGADRLPDAVAARPWLDRHLVDALERHGVTTADLPGAFGPLSADDTFYAYDSHWTEEGARRAAEAICGAAGFRASPDGEAGNRRAVPVRSPGTRSRQDLFAYAGLPFGSQRLEDRRAQGPQYHLQMRPDAEPFERLVVEVDEARLRDGPPRSANAESANAESANAGSANGERSTAGGAPGPDPVEPDVLLIGTSFSALSSLPQFLAACADRPVLDGSLAGVLAIRPLRRFFRKLHLPLPQTVVFETPLHEVLADPPESYGSLLAELPTHRVEPLLPRDAVELPLGLGDLTVGPEPQVIARLRPGTLLHTGEGSVAVRLRGRASPGLLLHVESGSHAYSAAWRPSRPTVIVPVLGLGGSGERDSREPPLEGEITLSIAAGQEGTGAAPAAASLDLRGVRVVTEAWTETIEGDALELRPEGAGFRLLPTLPDRLEPRDAIELRWRAGAEPAPLRLVARMADGSRHVLRLPPAQRLVVGLKTLAPGLRSGPLDANSAPPGAPSQAETLSPTDGAHRLEALRIVSTRAVERPGDVAVSPLAIRWLHGPATVAEVARAARPVQVQESERPSQWLPLAWRRPPVERGP